MVAATARQRQLTSPEIEFGIVEHFSRFPKKYPNWRADLRLNGYNGACKAM
jgi:hypothetical protein